MGNKEWVEFIWSSGKEETKGGWGGIYASGSVEGQ
jgi:hypothetical protein